MFGSRSALRAQFRRLGPTLSASRQLTAAASPPYSKGRSTGSSASSSGRRSRPAAEAVSAFDSGAQSSQQSFKRERAPGAIRGQLSNTSMVLPTIQWYPGHIAKAERRLKDSLRLVDVVIEVRDCRIPIATAHPEVANWVGNRPRVLAMNRADLVPDVARSAWREYLVSQGETPRFINAKQGRGVRELKKLALTVGSAVNEKRKRRGLLPRPVRCVVIGYPNVGKSALINRLVGKRAAKSSNKPGVTRNFQWVRISESIELLDMPGVIPAKLVSQDTALRLAVCDDIGQAAYDTQITAGLMIEELKRVAERFPGFVDLSILEKRFKVDATTATGEEYVHMAADRLYNGDTERTACRLLNEFRSGDLGPVTLEGPAMVGEACGDIITRRAREE